MIMINSIKLPDMINDRNNQDMIPVLVSQYQAALTVLVVTACSLAEVEFHCHHIPHYLQ